MKKYTLNKGEVEKLQKEIKIILNTYSKLKYRTEKIEFIYPNTKYNPTQWAIFSFKAKIKPIKLNSEEDIYVREFLNKQDIYIRKNISKNDNISFSFGAFISSSKDDIYKDEIILLFQIDRFKITKDIRYLVMTKIINIIEEFEL